MTEEERQEILIKSKVFFKDRIAKKHQLNTKKLKNLKKFKVNPFIDKYLANFAFGDDNAENMARALIYPRILGTSITTTFGTQMQFFCNEVLSSYASMITGIDIEFIDAVDRRKKYCQIKAGPNTINYDDITSIVNHFNSVRNLARTNRNMDINPSIDCIVGVFYGESSELSTMYKKVNEQYPVFCGKDFWRRLTGDENFYNELIEAFSQVAVEIDSRELIERTICELAEQIRARGNI